jgi:hypothetical protein
MKKKSYRRKITFEEKKHWPLVAWVMDRSSFTGRSFNKLGSIQPSDQSDLGSTR